MEKIISLFQRNYDGDRLVRDEVVPGAEWVLAGEGVATRKWDGTCCLFRGGKLLKRHEIKPAGKAPPYFEPATGVDANTGKQQGWLPVGEGAEDRYHREAMVGGVDADGKPFVDGQSYELCGPKIQSNPDRFDRHVLVPHGQAALNPQPPRDFAGLRAYLEANEIEGVVWHHPDGRRVKIKAKDFGIRRKPAHAKR
jgi:hypothetical protein